MSALNKVFSFSGYSFWCPGCKHRHVFNTHGTGPQWTFNDKEDSPTFEPSLLNTLPDHTPPGAGPKRCHLNITNGMIVFHPDCDHEFAGKTVPIPFDPTPPETPYE